MKRSFGVICIISIFYILALMVGYIGYSRQEQDETERLILAKAIDYSSDAALQEMLNTDNLELDYSEDGYLLVNPTLAVNAFVDTFCINYNIGLTGEAKNHVIQNYIPVICIAAYDGYYIAKYGPIQSGTNYPENSISDSRWGLTIGPKMPYTYRAGTENYALNMSGDYNYVVDGTNISKKKGLPTGLVNKSEVIAQINKTITSQIAYTVDNLNATNKNWKNSFFIPSQLSSLNGVNPISGPSFIALVQNVDLRTRSPISGFSVAGTRVSKARMVLAYVRNGIKYYCYADSAPGGIVADDLFTDPRDAAKAGYYADLEYMK